MKSGYWKLYKDVLLLQGDHMYTPTASEIYNYVFKNTLNFKTIIPHGKEELKGIEFSKYPLGLAILLQLDEDKKNIILSINSERDGISIPLVDFFERNADHVVSNNVWHPFVKDTLEDLKSELRKIKVNKLGEITLMQYLQVQKIQGYAIHDLTPGRMNAKEVAKNHRKDFNFSVFTGNLYPYQKEGYFWLAYMDKQDLGCILADEMGLGKTIQVIALLADYPKISRPSLLIVPATLLENWKREIQKFSPKLSVSIHQGPTRTGIAEEFTHYNLVITSYETAVRDKYLLKMIDWNILILDEAQAIKNPDAKRTKAVKSFARRSAIAMTGTPVQNNLIDLWSITDFALPGILGSREAFEKEFVLDISSASKVEPFISPLILRRRVQEVAKDLPDKIDIPQPLIMDKTACIEYEDIRRQTESEYGPKATLVALGRLRMYCAHPSLLEDGLNEDPAENSAKYRRLIEIIEEIQSNNEKVLVFTSWQKMTDIIVGDIANRLGLYTNKIDGRVKPKERQLLVDEFNNLNGAGVLVLNPIAGGVGLNITGANHVIHYNLEWNPAVVDQATARSYRRGQRLPVTVHRLYYVNTVEDVINERLEFKRTISETAVVGVAGKDEDYKYILDAIKKTPTWKG